MYKSVQSKAWTQWRLHVHKTFVCFYGPTEVAAKQPNTQESSFIAHSQIWCQSQTIHLVVKISWQWADKYQKDFTVKSPLKEVTFNVLAMPALSEPGTPCVIPRVKVITHWEVPLILSSEVSVRGQFVYILCCVQALCWMVGWNGV